MGDRTSADHLISQQPGLIPQVTRKLNSTRFHRTTIHTDHFYMFIHLIWFQVPTNDETLESKYECKRMLCRHDHEVKAYRADNSRFNSKSLMDDCELARQKLIFCGAGAHSSKRNR